MRKSHVQRLLRNDLLPHLPGFAVFETAMVRVPVGLVMCNISFDRSNCDSLSFAQVMANAMPLWIPFDAWRFSPGSIDLSMSGETDDAPLPPRNKDYSRWGHVAEIKRRAIPLFDKLGTPEGLYRHLREHNGREAEKRGYDYQPDAQTEEIVAGAAIIVGDMAGAIAGYESVARKLEDSDDEYGVQKKAGLARMLEAACSSRHDALALLQEWEAFTIQNLRLEPLLDPDRWSRI